MLLSREVDVFKCAAQLVDYLCLTCKLGVIVCICNPITLEDEKCGVMLNYREGVRLACALLDPVPKREKGVLYT